MTTDFQIIINQTARTATAPLLDSLASNQTAGAITWLQGDVFDVVIYLAIPSTSSGTASEVVGIPSGYSLALGGRDPDDMENGLLFSAVDFVEEEDGDGNICYRKELSLNTSALDAWFDDNISEAQIRSVVDIELRNAGNTTRRTLSRVEIAILRQALVGDEGVPTSGSPVYPGPTEIVTYNVSTFAITQPTVAITHAPGWILTTLKAATSAGAEIKNNGGTQVALFGAGGGTNTTLAGGLNVGGTVTARASSLYDGLSIAGRGSGTNSYVSQVTTAALTASRTHTLPDNTGTIAELNYAQTWTATQTFAAVSADSYTTNAASLEVNDAASVALVANVLPLSGVNANVITITGTSPFSTVSGLTVGAVYYLINGTGGNLTVTHSASLYCPGATNLVLGSTQAAILIPRSSTTASIVGAVS